MPIYRYRCESCEETTEVWARMSDPPPEACPACGGGPMRKAVARTAFHLKGGGWYAQGYGSGGGGAKSDGASAGSGGSASSGSGDSASSGSGDSGGSGAGDGGGSGSSDGGGSASSDAS